MKFSKWTGLLPLALLTLAGCGGGGAGGSVASRAYLGTQAPGDVWNYSLSSGSFTASNQTLGHTYSGTSMAVPSGFLKLTVDNTNDANVPVGSAAYAIEVPNTALVIKPADSAGSPIVACGMGQPAANGSTLNYNWVSIPRNGWTNQDTAYGTVTFGVNGSTYNGDILSYRIDGSLTGHEQDGFSDNGGRLNITSGNVGYTGALTPSGTFMLDMGQGAGGVIGVVQPSSDVDLADLSATNRHFLGMLVNPFSNGSGGKTECVWAQGLGGGQLQGGDFDDVDAGTHGTAGSGVTVTLDSQPAPGLIQATLAGQDQSGPVSASMILVASQVNGKYVLYAFGSDNGGYNVVLVEQ